ncbi:PREDICTED: uncharacterized protein LOC109335447 [Lupinus angustifolius]|uniref:uncharacterized protein LOC109335447 n=1 Tax=Lupinus angustifolius TaxID=3871 RepID=UPI00092F2EB0|nr:PREDICTED: uncharacterized protein LOC109335447 [Lupinus angustifolius]
MGDILWCFFGDFNVVRSIYERSCESGQGCRREDRLFNSWIGEMELIDLPLIGRSFTWFHPGNSSMSRVDRFLLSPDWLNAWPNSTQWALNREFSNHCPVILRYKKLEKGPIPFKFNNCWLHHPSFAAVVSNSWANSDVVGKWEFIIKEKLKHLKKDIKVWNKECFGCLDTKLVVLVSDIQAINLIGESMNANQIADRNIFKWSGGRQQV